MMPVQNVRHPAHELVEPVDRNEVLLQDVGRGPARHRLELLDVVARLVVAPFDPLTAEQDRIEHVASQRPSARPVGDDAHPQTIAPVALIPGHQAVLDGDRLVGPDVGGGADGVVRAGIDVGVVEDHIAMTADVGLEVLAVGAQRHDLAPALDAHVVGEPERGLDDHAQRAVAADGAVEDLRVLGGAGPDQPPVGEHDADRPDRLDQRPLADVAPVHVDAQRTAHGEVGVALHDLHREVVRIDGVLDLAPGDACLDRDLLALLRERHDTVEPSHVDLQRALGRRLSALAEAPAADRHRSRVRPHRLDDLVDRRGNEHPVDHDRVDPGDVVDDGAGAGERRPRERARREQADETRLTQRATRGGRRSWSR